MRFLNASFPLINTYNPKDPTVTLSSSPTAAALELQGMDQFDFDAWYCLFSCEHSFKIYKIKDLVGEKVFKKIIKKQVFLVLDNTLEPFEKSIDTIYQNIVIQEKIPASQIILLTNMHDAKFYSDSVASRSGQEPIRIFWYTVFEQDLKNAINHIYRSDFPTTLTLKKYHKKFLYFNRRWRLHRPFLITLLHSRGLIEHGYVSFGPCDDTDTWNHRWPQLMNYFRTDSEMTELLDNNQSVKQLPPLFLDTDELHINRAEATPNTNQYYEDSYFSVISETTYFTKWYSSARFLSEKAFKPIAMRHPFILASVPNSLEIYKIMGYKTFSPYVDESYDQELDDGKRMLMILSEIERLCNLTESELSVFLANVKEICDYNYDVLVSKTQFITEL
jgi:hypothetical protein